jgi:mannose-1-phosphate guanylyltransferase/mannose-6-phosphate isomerase
MIAVIFCGGSGSRLWPLSTSDYPKHLLALVGKRSLLQETYERVRSCTETIYFVTEQGHAAQVKQQLPEVTDDAFIIEPGRRGTAGCLVAALDRIARHHDENEPIAFLHSDHHVRDVEGFKQSFALACRASTASGRICLVGVEPTYPATGMGYIEKGELFKDESEVYNVVEFKEKPTYEVASQYVESGRYLWNCGYFVGSLKTFLDNIKTASPELHRQYDALHQIADADRATYEKTYLEFEAETIDYALIEKIKDLLVVPATFDWMDVGSFKDLHQANASDESGNHLRGENIELIDVANTYIRNEETKPIAVIGLDNVVVVNTKDGILVARKDLSQKVGEIAKKIQAS